MGAQNIAVIFSPASGNLKNLLMPLFLMGCFPVDFQEVKRPLRTKSVKRPIKVGKRPINEGKRPIKAKVLVGISVRCLMGCFRAPLPWRKMAPLKRPIKRSMKIVIAIAEKSRHLVHSGTSGRTRLWQTLLQQATQSQKQESVKRSTTSLHQGKAFSKRRGIARADLISMSNRQRARPLRTRPHKRVTMIMVGFSRLKQPSRSSTLGERSSF